MPNKRQSLALHWKIIIGLIVGIVVGVLALELEADRFINNWVTPVGTIFIRTLKLIAVPLIIASLVKGITGISDVGNLSKLGGKTVGLYIFTTIISVSIGLLLVNVIQPGINIPDGFTETIMQRYSEDVKAKQASPDAAAERAPLQIFVDMVPENIFEAAGNNRNMLQVIFFTIFLSIAMMMIPKEKSEPLRLFFDGLNDVVLKMVDIIMKFAPYGVMALLAGVVVANGDILAELFWAILKFVSTVALGLFIMIALVYPTMVKILGKVPLAHFFKSIAPAQLLAFSTSSSAATLPVTMERVEEELGVSKDVSSFVLPLGATINMDGTSLYLGVSTIFIAQALGMSLSFADNLTIILTCTLASIGTAAVPSASIVMLFIVLEQLSIPAAGIALIFPTDRILDMLRTSVNVTGDATIATVVARTEGKISPVKYMSND